MQQLALVGKRRLSQEANCSPIHQHRPGNFNFCFVHSSIRCAIDTIIGFVFFKITIHSICLVNR